jgi:hypothetical protein
MTPADPQTTQAPAETTPATPAAPILARLSPLAFAEDTAAPAEIMVFPAGTHTITATQADKKVTRKIIIDAATATAMQAALEAHNAGTRKAYFDFDHDDGSASAWPAAFRWDAGARGKPAGVYAAVQWSASGAAAIAGRDYRSFSPAFYVDTGNPARVIGAPINMGGLVNAPAFHTQSPIWAREFSILDSRFSIEGASAPAIAHNNNRQTHITMTEEEQTASTAATQAKDTAIAALKQENAALKAKDAARRKTDATAAVAAAIARGALPAKDEAIQAKWRGMIEENPEHAALLDAMEGNGLARVLTTTGSHIQAKDGALETLRAYAAVKPAGKDGAAMLAAAIQRGAIYAKDVAPLFKESGFALGPILAGHDLGTITSDLLVQRSLSYLKHTFPFLGVITTDFSGDNANFKQDIITRLKGALNVSTYQKGVGYGSNDAHTTDVKITINQHVGVPISFDVEDLASTSRDLFGEQTEVMHYALGSSLVDYVLSLITAAKFPKATAEKLSLFGRPTLTKIAREQNKDKVPPYGRFALLNPDFYEKLGQDGALVQLAAYQKPELITEYRLPRVAGYQPYEAVTLPETADLAGFFGTSESLALATRLPNDYTQSMPGATGGGIVSVVTNPDTGISVQLVQYINHDKAVATARVALMYGAAVGNKDTGRRLTQAEEETATEG